MVQPRFFILTASSIQAESIKLQVQKMVSWMVDKRIRLVDLEYNCHHLFKFYLVIPTFVDITLVVVFTNMPNYLYNIWYMYSLNKF